MSELDSRATSRELTPRAAERSERLHPNQIGVIEQRLGVALAELARCEGMSRDWLLAGVEIFRQTIRQKMEVGDLCAEVKEIVGHGNFIPTIQTISPLNRSTITPWMRMAYHREHVEQMLSDDELAPQLTQNKIIAALRELEAGEDPEPALTGPARLPSAGSVVARLEKLGDLMIHSGDERREEVIEELVARLPLADLLDLEGLFSDAAYDADPTNQAEDDDDESSAGEDDHDEIEEPDDQIDDHVGEVEAGPPATRTVWEPQVAPYRTYAERALSRMNGGV